MIFRPEKKGKLPLISDDFRSLGKSHQRAFQVLGEMGTKTAPSVSQQCRHSSHRVVCECRRCVAGRRLQISFQFTPEGLWITVLTMLRQLCLKPRDSCHLFLHFLVDGGFFCLLLLLGRRLLCRCQFFLRLLRCFLFPNACSGDPGGAEQQGSPGYHGVFLRHTRISDSL